MNNRIISAGFIVRLKNGKYLLGKADQHQDPCYTIFKGQSNEGESLISTAIRELKEESGINIESDERLIKSMSTVPIFVYSMHNKDVYVFYLNDVNGVLDNFEFKCNSFYGVNNRPEISEFKEFELEELENNVFPSQMGLVNVLKRKVGV